MPESKTKRWPYILIAALLLASILAGLWYWHTARLKQARWQASNPSVLITFPPRGSTQPAGRWIPVIASATGPRPIKQIEFWVNGELIETQETELEDGVAVIYGDFVLLVQEGLQTFVVRAVDAEGYIGQSDPVNIKGSAAATDQEPVFQVGFDPETDLEALAAEYDVDLPEIIRLNEDVLNQPEGMLQIPLKPEQDENIPDSSDQIPQELTAENGYVSGKICYPSQYIPEMTTYFQNLDTGQVSTKPLSQNQTSYGISLPPGQYRAFAWLKDYSRGGAYTKAVPCGLTTSCTDHSPLTFQVQAGGWTQDIDICDWDNPASVPEPEGKPPSQQASKNEPIATETPMLQPVDTFPAGNAWNLPFSLFIPETPPGPPTNLQARVDQCQIILGWDAPQPAADSYQVWISGENGRKQLAATLAEEQEEASSVWYEFQSPVSGLVSVWVESVNALGKTPSQVQTIQLERNCNQATEEVLHLNTTQLEIADGYENVYLYLSVEDRPEERIPSNDDAFLVLQDGVVHLDQYHPGDSSFLVNPPEDGSLQISGECWGWSGGMPVRISSFNESIPETNRSESSYRLGDDQCALTYKLEYQGVDESTYMHISNPPEVPAPFNVRVEKIGQGDYADPSLTYFMNQARVIRWQWNGDPKTISGFAIEISKPDTNEGYMLWTIPVNTRHWMVVVPFDCGDLQFIVYAIKKDGSGIGGGVDEDLGICTLYACVTIDYMYIGDSCDRCCCNLKYGSTDTLEAYGFIRMNNDFYWFPPSADYFPIKAKNFLYGKTLASFTTGTGRYIAKFSREPFSLHFATWFFDYDKYSQDDDFGVHVNVYDFETDDQALKQFGNPQKEYSPYGVMQKSTWVVDTAATMLRYRVWFWEYFPQP